MSTLSDAQKHVEKIARKAYLEVMGCEGILGIVLNRESLPESVLLALDDDDVTDLYDEHVGPMIDRLTAALARNAGIKECSECPEFIDPADKDAGHGMCGSCLHNAHRSGWFPGSKD